MSLSDIHFPTDSQQFHFFSGSYDYGTLPDRLYGSPPVQEAIMVDETHTPESPDQTESIPSESSESSNTSQQPLPLDEYLEFCSDSSDGEMEEASPDDTATTPEAISCRWEGCSKEFDAMTTFYAWLSHVTSAHVKPQEDGRRLRSGTKLKCKWDRCSDHFLSQRFAAHFETHFTYE